MKLSTIKTLNNHTNNIDILKICYDMGEYKMQKVLELLVQMEKAEMYPISQEVRDKVALEYAKEIDRSEKIFTPLACLITSSAFISLLGNLSDKVIDKYFAVGKKLNDINEHKINEIFINTGIILNYKKDYIELAELAIKEKDNADLINLIKTSTKDGFGHSFTTIKKLVEAYKYCSETKKGENLVAIEQIARAEDLQNNGNEILITDLIEKLEAAEDKLEVDILKDAVANPDWVSIVTFKDIYTTIEYAVNNGYEEYSIIFDTYVISNRTPEQICEMLDYVNKYPARFKYFTDAYTLKSMTWEEQKNLFDEFDLMDDGNYKKFRKVKKAATKDRAVIEAIPNLYTIATRAIGQEEYETSVQEWLNECETIQAFANVLEQNYTANVDIDKKDTIIVPKLK